MRKYILLFLLCLTLSTLTGCDWIDKISSAFQGVGENISTDMDLNKLKNGNYSAETIQLGIDLTSKKAAYDAEKNNHNTKYPFWQNIANGLSGKGWTDAAFNEYKRNKTTTELNAAQADLKASMNNDEIRQSKEEKKKDPPWMLMLIVGGVAAIAGLILWLRSRPKAVPMTVAATPAKETRKVARTKDLDVNAKLACEGICKKYNLNLDKELSKVGGNYTELLNQFIMMGKT